MTASDAVPICSKNRKKIRDMITYKLQGDDAAGQKGDRSPGVMSESAGTSAYAQLMRRHGFVVETEEVGMFVHP